MQVTLVMELQATALLVTTNTATEDEVHRCPCCQVSICSCSGVRQSGVAHACFILEILGFAQARRKQKTYVYIHIYIEIFIHIPGFRH